MLFRSDDAERRRQRHLRRVGLCLGHGKKNTLAAKRQAFAFITKEAVVKKTFDEIAPKYQDRNGGYVRITRIGPRRGDGAEMAIIELI